VSGPSSPTATLGLLAREANGPCPGGPASRRLRCAGHHTGRRAAGGRSLLYCHRFALGRCAAVHHRLPCWHGRRLYVRSAASTGPLCVLLGGYRDGGHHSHGEAGMCTGHAVPPIQGSDRQRDRPCPLARQNPFSVTQFESGVGPRISHHVLLPGSSAHSGNSEVTVGR
jgi:hypothetical protein